MIAPPNEEYKKKPPNPFKRAGRQNHDFCDACSEAGNLICCDYCCSSFHLSCHDPPLEETDIPCGIWLCHTCTMKEKIAREKEESDKANAKEVPQASESSELGLSSQEPSTSSLSIEIEMKDSENTTPTTDSEPMQVDDEIVKEPKEEEIEAPKVEEKIEEVVVIEKPVELSPFEELIRVASLLNPKQFELPIEMTEPFPFPGTERAEPIRNGRRVKNKRTVELDSYGCVPLPAKLCFSCSKSCKKAPLISCDYCSLYYHQDCLDPPMTALPAGRWMCPNHPQHFIVSLLNIS